MDTIIAVLSSIEPQHWLVFGLILLIAEMASGTTYLLWPAVAAFITAAVSLIGVTNWVGDIALFAALVILLTMFGHPLVQRWRQAGKDNGLNERSASLIGERGIVANFSNGVGSIRLNDTIWRAESDDVLEAGQQVEVASVEGTMLKVKRV